MQFSLPPLILVTLPFPHSLSPRATTPISLQNTAGPQGYQLNSQQVTIRQVINKSYQSCSPSVLNSLTSSFFFFFRFASGLQA